MRVVTVEVLEAQEAVEEAEEAGVAHQVIMLTEAKEVMEIMGEEAVEGLHTVRTNLRMPMREMAGQARMEMEETMGIQLHLSLMEVRHMEARAVLV